MALCAPIRQPAATLWYHSHVHGGTAEQVYAGLAGVLLVTDEEEQALGLPSEYGVDDLPLVLQDREFEDGRLILPAGMMTLMHGRRGNTLLVNGTVGPVARVPGRLVRLRLVNGSNARIYHLAFEDDRPFHWIASEGGLLEMPVELRSLSLAPGERAEILVDFANGRAVALETGQDTNAPMMMGMMMDLRARGSELLGGGRETVLRFEPGGGEATQSNIPARLVPRQGVDASEAVRRRRFVLTMGLGGMMDGMMGGGTGGGMGMDGMMGGGTGGGMGVHGINGRAFDIGSTKR